MSDERREEFREMMRGHNRASYARSPEVYIASRQLRRARLAGVATERFNPSEVFDRDNWVCQLCTRPVDRAAQYPDPLSVSLDHIVPIVRGGGHTRANTQCAHLRCNLIKGVR